MVKILKKKEIIFISAILILALALWGGMSFVNKGRHGSIKITVDGQEYGTYSLSKDQIIKINDTNVCEIKDGKAYMLSADCPDHLCMKQKSTKKEALSYASLIRLLLKVIKARIQEIRINYLLMQ